MRDGGGGADGTQARQHPNPDYQKTTGAPSFTMKSSQ